MSYENSTDFTHSLQKQILLTKLFASECLLFYIQLNSWQIRRHSASVCITNNHGNIPLLSGHMTEISNHIISGTTHDCKAV